MVISVQNFFNEIDLLTIKCEALRGAVDLFVVAESPITFSGLNKPMYFQEKKHLFDKYPIHYVDLSGIEETDFMKESPWNREQVQKNAVLEEVKKINPEIVLWGDTDETPRPDVVERFRSMDVPTANLEMDMLLYYFNREHPDKWPYHRIAKWNGEIAPRGDFSLPMIPDAGWHFEYFGLRQMLLDKINATSHAIEDTARSFYKAVRAGSKPGLEKCSPYPVEKLPDYVRAFKDFSKFKPFFLDQNFLTTAEERG